MNIILLIAGLLIGALAALIFARQETQKKTRDLGDQLVNAAKMIALAENDKMAEIRIAGERVAYLETDKAKMLDDLAAERKKNEEMNSLNSKLEAELRFMGEKLEKQKAEIEDLQKKFSLEFENVANRLFKQHSSDFSERSQKNLSDVLNPLKEKLQSFEKKVEETHNIENLQREGLRAEVTKLFEFTQNISKEAGDLTRALKGDVKVMGNWGEVVLERILEQSGLEKDSMFKKQVSITNDEGRRLQPDVVIFLPDNKHVIIDAKVSLVAYERYISAATDEERQKSVKDHITSVYNHLKILSSKDYQMLEGFGSPDFVLMFIPIEASFSLAIREDTEIFNYAWENRIVMVSPSTLLATLKTIQSIWKLDKQNKNAMEIARQGGSLYDKFKGFVDDLESLGKAIRNSQSAYEDAMNKLVDGKGNIMKQVENLKKLGAKTSKSLPEKFLGDDEPLISESTE